MHPATTLFMFHDDVRMIIRPDIKADQFNPSMLSAKRSKQLGVMGFEIGPGRDDQGRAIREPKGKGLGHRTATCTPSRKFAVWPKGRRAAVEET
jgi:hypothetical protein